MGRGVRSPLSYNEGDVVHIADILILSPDDTKTVNQTALKNYTFVYNQDRDCLVLGLGELFNHSDSPNLSFELGLFHGREVMVFIAKRDIDIGEQLFIDYNQDAQVNLTDYINSKSLK